LALLGKTEQHQSWGRYPHLAASQVEPLLWRSDLPDLSKTELPLLPYGYGRSYGDSCLNEGGIQLDASHLNRFLAFDTENGLIRCEAGISLAEVLKVIVPKGWFLPVTPGTKFVSVGGAIANDIHGKNHHRSGTFGCHVTQFELWRSSGERFICSPSENVELFRATIGGLGLTGLILWAEFKLKPITSPFIKMESIRFASLGEFFELSAESDTKYDYTVSWVDCIVTGKHMGRGRFMRGDSYNPGVKNLPRLKKGSKLTAPFDTPAFMLNTFSFQTFNTLYYHVHWQKRKKVIVHYDPFFYPLDSIHEWNRLYGTPGFLQYQLVVPDNDNHVAIKEIFRLISNSGQSTNVVVLKNFGPIKSPGILSFPQPGVTLASDFTYKGQKTLQLLEELDQIVRAAGGRVYPAKDARMSAESFQIYYPNWREFAQYVDPKFSSSFWRRVTAPVNSLDALTDFSNNPTVQLNELHLGRVTN